MTRRSIPDRIANTEIRSWGQLRFLGFKSQVVVALWFVIAVTAFAACNATVIGVQNSGNNYRGGCYPKNADGSCGKASNR